MALSFLLLACQAAGKFVAANAKTFKAAQEGGAPKKSAAIVETVTSLVSLLHSLLLDLSTLPVDEAQRLQNAAMAVCEQFWLGDLVNKNEYMVNLLPVLTVKALALDSEEAEPSIARLFNVRAALNTLDYDDASIGSFKKLLTKTMSSPNFVGSSTGSKYLTYLFTVHDSLVQCLHDAIKAQIPEAGKNQLRSYGEMYLRAWKISHDETRAVLESAVLAPLMHAAMDVASPAMRKNLRLLLAPSFHEAKKDQSVGEMLNRLCVQGRASEASAREEGRSPARERKRRKLFSRPLAQKKEFVLPVVGGRCR